MQPPASSLARKQLRMARPSRRAHAAHVAPHGSATGPAVSFDRLSQCELGSAHRLNGAREILALGRRPAGVVIRPHEEVGGCGGAVGACM